MMNVIKRFVLLLIILLATGLQVVTSQIRGLDLIGDKEKITIPFSMEQGFIVIKSRMQNTFPMRFIFDTGAEHTIIFNKMYTDILNMKYQQRIPIIGSDLSFELYASIVRNIIMDIKGAKKVRRDVLVLEKNYLRLFESAGIHVDGIIGGEFFRGLVIEIDYKKEELHLYHPASWSPPSDKKFQVLPLEIINYKPYMETDVVTDGDTARLKLLVDTGASLTFLIHANSHPSLHIPENVIPGNLGAGLGGDVLGYTGLLQNINIGSFAYQNVLCSFQNLNASILRENEYFRNGLIGNRLLSRFNVIIDYNRSKLYLKPKKGYKKKFEYDKSGLTIYAFGPNLNHFYIKSVLQGSPADEAGLEPGDILEKICKKNHKKWKLPDIVKMLKGKEGTKVKFHVLRNGVEHEIEFKLRDMLKRKKNENTL